MALQINTDMSAIAYHIVDGPVTFQYAVDAQHAVSSHPNEWSSTPWSQEDAAASRAKLEEQGVTLAPAVELSPEDQEALDEYNKLVADAEARLAAYHEKKSAEKAEADQVKADEALIASPPPRPDPTVRRPFGRKGEPTPAELKQMKKAADKKADDDRIAKEKADADKAAGGAIITG